MISLICLMSMQLYAELYSLIKSVLSLFKPETPASNALALNLISRVCVVVTICVLPRIDYVWSYTLWIFWLSCMQIWAPQLQFVLLEYQVCTFYLGMINPSPITIKNCFLRYWPFFAIFVLYGLLAYWQNTKSLWDGFQYIYNIS